MSNQQDFNPFLSNPHSVFAWTDNIGEPQAWEEPYQSFPGGVTDCHGAIHLDVSAMATNSFQSAYDDFPINFSGEFVDDPIVWDSLPANNKDRRVDLHPLPTSNTPNISIATEKVSEGCPFPVVLDSNILRDSTPPSAHRSSKCRSAKKSITGLQGNSQRIEKRHGPGTSKSKQVVSQSSNSSARLQRSELDVTEQSILSSVASNACIQWRQSFPGVFPGENEIRGLHLAYHAPLDLLREWFQHHDALDNADSSCQNPATQELDVTLPYRDNRRKCNRRKVGKASNSSSQSIIRDEQQPYACTSRCGAKFKSKASWKKHEEINYPQELWYCRTGTCNSKPVNTRVRFRKDHFRSHLRKHHGHKQVLDRDLRRSRFPIDSSFSRQCILQNCDEYFDGWEERINHIAKEFEKAWDIVEWRDMDQPIDDADKETDSDDELGTSDDDSSDSNDSHDNHGGSTEPGFEAGSGSNSGSGSGRDHHGSGQFKPSSTSSSHHQRRDGAGDSYSNGFHSQWQATHRPEAQPSTTPKVQHAIRVPLRTWLPLKMSLLTVTEGLQYKTGEKATGADTAHVKADTVSEHIAGSETEAESGCSKLSLLGLDKLSNGSVTHSGLSASQPATDRSHSISSQSTNATEVSTPEKQTYGPVDFKAAAKSIVIFRDTPTASQHSYPRRIKEMDSAYHR